MQVSFVFDRNSRRQDYTKSCQVTFCQSAKPYRDQWYVYYLVISYFPEDSFTYDNYIRTDYSLFTVACRVNQFSSSLLFSLCFQFCRSPAAVGDECHWNQSNFDAAQSVFTFLVWEPFHLCFGCSAQTTVVGRTLSSRNKISLVSATVSWRQHSCSTDTSCKKKI